ncbi:MAG: LuxR C-terminal-related transcriptional regulator [Novosphingobium sp.]
METITKIFLVDGDISRRARISHYLAQCGIHVEPYENAAELRGHMADFGLVLIYDAGPEIALVIDCMADAGNWLPVIGFSEDPDPRVVAKAVHYGAIDYLAWPFAENEVVGILHDAAVLAARIGQRKNREYTAKKRIDRLSKREREVLLSVANGMSSNKIAEQLEISPRTVEIHRSNMLNKMGANNTSEAIRFAVEADFVV